MVKTIAQVSAAPTKSTAKKPTAKKTPSRKTAAAPKVQARAKTAPKKAPAQTTPTQALPTSKKAAAPKIPPNADERKRQRVFGYSFSSVYPLYLQKVEKKGRTREELDEVITWLTGYRGRELAQVLEDRRDLETFFAKAPRLNPKMSLIQGVVCGVRVEELTDPLMQKIRYLDKLVDELAQGKPMEKILRA